MSGRRLLRRLPLAVLLVVPFLGTASLRAGGESKYPHVNLAINYQVDPKWPQKPKDYVWGHMPGVAVDASDNVYVFTRATPPVQVYDSAGKFLRAWGEKTIAPLGAHHIKVDYEGN